MRVPTAADRTGAGNDQHADAERAHRERPRDERVIAAADDEPPAVPFDELGRGVGEQREVSAVRSARGVHAALDGGVHMNSRERGFAAMLTMSPGCHAETSR